MSYNRDQQQIYTAPVRRLLAAALVLGCAFGTVTFAGAQTITPPITPTDITPPTGNTAFLLGRAQGTQGYVCLPKGTGASWTVNGARPEATLFESFVGQDVQIITHFLSPNTNPIPPNPVPFGNPTWQSSFDSSKVWAQAAETITAAPTRVARIPGRLPVSCAGSRVAKGSYRRQNYDKNYVHPTIKHQRRICSRRRLHRFDRCRQANACAV